MAIATGLFLAGTALNIYGNYKSNMAQAENMREQSLSLQNKIIETRRRSGIELNNIVRGGRQVQANQKAAFAKGGVDVSSGSVISMAEETSRLIMEQYIETQRNIEYEIETMLNSAASLEEAAKRVEDAAALAAVGSALSAGGELYMAKGQPKFGASGEPPKSKPKPKSSPSGNFRLTPKSLNLLNKNISAPNKLGLDGRPNINYNGGRRSNFFNFDFE